jgi:hypothetical protein
VTRKDEERGERAAAQPLAPADAPHAVAAADVHAVLHAQQQQDGGDGRAHEHPRVEGVADRPVDLRQRRRPRLAQHVHAGAERSDGEDEEDVPV